MRERKPSPGPIGVYDRPAVGRRRLGRLLLVVALALVGTASLIFWLLRFRHA